ncbi:hypothetical protein TRSC58_07705 [Trypanosoma rangeli SC58]|uniref:Uncharacterized protein n=1 Tax=Trypanosoma rangeli SC58 TaxID=429131 RepID=A0A061IRN8_TRYRA|nr:hypothetical protein TRSC58_07705 [Trypanosoma rangeli SC58]
MFLFGCVPLSLCSFGAVRVPLYFTEMPLRQTATRCLKQQQQKQIAAKRDPTVATTHKETQKESGKHTVKHPHVFGPIEGEGE